MDLIIAYDFISPTSLLVSLADLLLLERIAKDNDNAVTSWN